MKKNKLLVLLLGICSLALSGCDFFAKLLSNDGSSSGSLISGNIEIKQTMIDLSHNSYSIINSAPSVGTTNVLVIPVWFNNDSSEYITSDTNKQNVWNDIKSSFFGTNAECGNRSLKTYFEEMSLGKLKINGTVSDWYEIDDSVSNYYSESGTSSGAMFTKALVKKATTWYFQTSGESKTKYDIDGDGYYDSVILIYAAPDYSNMPNYSAHDYYNMWAYVFWEQEYNPTPSVPIPNSYMWASYDFMYSKSNALNRAGSRYGYGDNSHCNLDTHIYIHEFGHLLGLGDYYDYADSYIDISTGKYRGYSPTGGFIMQDSNVGSHDPFTAMSLGWASPYVASKEETITIGDFQSGHDLILLTPGFNSYNSPFDEYFLLELYTPSGLNQFDVDYNYLNAGITGSKDIGIRLWHVDARLTNSELTTSLFSNVNQYKGVGFAMSNSYNDKNYGSKLGSEYYNYNILQLIRNDYNETYQPKSRFTSEHLFKEGDSFSMRDYSSQFVNGSKLNSGKSLGWKFKIDSLSKNPFKAVITISKD